MSDSKGAAIDKILDNFHDMHDTFVDEELGRDNWAAHVKTKKAEAHKAILALLAQEAKKAVLKAEIKARTDTMRIYNKSFKEDGAKDE